MQLRWLGYLREPSDPVRTPLPCRRARSLGLRGMRRGASLPMLAPTAGGPRREIGWLLDPGSDASRRRGTRPSHSPGQWLADAGTGPRVGVEETRSNWATGRPMVSQRKPGASGSTRAPVAENAAASISMSARAVLLAVVTLVAFAPTFGAELVEWDDRFYVEEKTTPARSCRARLGAFFLELRRRAAADRGNAMWFYLRTSLPRDDGQVPGEALEQRPPLEPSVNALEALVRRT